MTSVETLSRLEILYKALNAPIPTKTIGMPALRLPSHHRFCHFVFVIIRFDNFVPNTDVYQNRTD